MLSANIYSVELLESRSMEAISFGLGLVGEHVGGIAVNKSLIVRLPQADGVVRAKNVGYEKLDPFIDLHIFAAPYNESSLGFSYIKTGVSWINLDTESEKGSHLTTAHEVAHSLGFVTPESPQSAPGDKFHCSCEECIMGSALTSIHVYDLQETKSWFGLRKKTMEVMTEVIQKQQSFCGDCVVDMRTNATKNIEDIRHRRVITKKVISSSAQRSI